MAKKASAKKKVKPRAGKQFKDFEESTNSAAARHPKMGKQKFGGSKLSHVSRGGKRGK